MYLSEAGFMQQNRLNILVSPLDWGLGHATRCIPVINELLQAGHSVILAGEGRSLLLLQKEFPSLKTLMLNGFSPSYPKSGYLLLHLATQLPVFIAACYRDNSKLKKIIALHNIDVVISDNRYGLRNKKVFSVLLTHQLMVKMPRGLKFAEYLVHRIILFLIRFFDCCFVPDTEKAPGLSGDLSHKYKVPANVKFLGVLSRFCEKQDLTVKPAKLKITAILSGPEPQRSILEMLLIQQSQTLDYDIVIIGGRPETENKKDISQNITCIPFANSDQLQQLIDSSTLIICRSGYSSVMDMACTGSKALFIPTPGQTEQLYLARFHTIKGNAYSVQQEYLNLKVQIPEAMQFNGFTREARNTELREAIGILRKK